MNAHRIKLIVLRHTSLRPVMALLLLVAALVAGERDALAQNANAIETINFDQTFDVDELGKAVITIKMKLTASQFQEWQGKYGQNKSLLKRDMNKFLSMYDTFDWDVSEKQMDREITVSLKARGTVVNKGGGVQEFRVPKEWRGGERRDNSFTFNYVEGIAPGVVGQFNIRLTAPASASNYREQLAENGEKVIQYSVPVAGSSSWMLLAGIIAGALGAGLIGLTLLGRQSPVTRTTSASSRAASSSALRHNKPVDPPSMSTIPLAPTETGERNVRDARR